MPAPVLSRYRDQRRLLVVVVVRVDCPQIVLAVLAENVFRCQQAHQNTVVLIVVLECAVPPDDAEILNRR